TTRPKPQRGSRTYELDLAGPARTLRPLAAALKTTTRTWNMLAIISDLHLNDGTTASLLAPGTIDLLCERLCDLAWRASWRADGCYRPIDRIDLVLLGDVLDIISSRRWLASP